jgi:transposase InsO family protein
VRYAFISAEKASYPVAVLCSALEVSTSGYYASLNRPESGHAGRDAELRVKVRATFEKSGRRYGAPRILKALKAEGESTSQKRVARLMTEEQLAARKRKKFISTTNSEHDFKVPENLLARDFTAQEPNEKWVGDITYLRTSDGWLFLAAIIDCFSRLVVGYAVRETLETEVASAALEQALTLRRPPPGLLFHSDRGVQYASNEYTEVLEGVNATPSMSRKGNCWDNAVSESFFSSLKFEIAARLDGSESKEMITSAVRDFIHFYNFERLHSTIGYTTPADFERVARMKRAA